MGELMIGVLLSSFWTLSFFFLLLFRNALAIALPSRERCFCSPLLLLRKRVLSLRARFSSFLARFLALLFLCRLFVADAGEACLCESRKCRFEFSFERAF